MIDKKELERLCGVLAGLLPLNVGNSPDVIGQHIYSVRAACVADTCKPLFTEEACRAHAKTLVAAANAIPELLAENEALQARVSRLEREVQELEARVPKWRIISEDEPPLDVNLLLAYFSEWPSPEWAVESGWAGSTRGGWLHGQATHWMPLPETPTSPSENP